MERFRKRIPTALSIAGSDSGGGAGIQADLKTFAALGVHGTSAITCVTAQNPRRVSGIQPCSPRIVRRQIEAVFEALPPAAIKTGMLYSTEIIRVVARFLRRHQRTPIVVDPVMVAGSGARLLERPATGALIDELLPLALLVTPNLAEAEILAGMRIKSIEEMRAAARRIHSKCGCAVLVKGGHLSRMKEAADIFFDGETELLLSAPFVRNVRTHGTGCAYSAAAAAFLAKGWGLARAVKAAKTYISEAIANSLSVKKHRVLDHRIITRITTPSAIRYHPNPSKVWVCT